MVAYNPRLVLLKGVEMHRGATDALQTYVESNGGALGLVDVLHGSSYEFVRGRLDH